MFYDRKKYTLEHGGTVVNILEPTNWKDDEKNFQRHETYHGITTELTSELTFIKEARDFLNSILESDGVNADVRLVKQIKNPQTDLWEKDYEGWVDFLTYNITDTKFTVKFNTDPLVTLFKSKLSSKVELERETNLNDEPIQVLDLSRIFIEGREILLTNKLSYPKDFAPYLELRSSNNNEWIRPFYLVESGNKDQGILDVISQLTYSNRKFNNVGATNENFIDVNEHGIDMKYTVTGNIRQSWYIVNRASNLNIKIRIAIYSFSSSYIYNREHVIWEYNGDSNNMPKSIDVPVDIVLNMGLNESASLQYSINTNGDDNLELHTGTSYYNIVEGKWESFYIDDNGNSAVPFYETNISVYEDSDRLGSVTNCLRIYEFAERLNDIILGSKFESKLLGRASMDQYSEDGYLSDLVLSHGMWIRGMDKNIDKYKPIATSLKYMLESFDAISPIGIDLNFGKFKLEERSYFYQKYVTIQLGEITDLILTPSEKDHVSTITVGYEKAGGYEEEQGLDEYNRETEYNTILNKTENTSKLISRYRADSYGLETIRRENPDVGLASDLEENQDSKFDDNIWFIDANSADGQTNLVVSSWDKRFAKAPTGVYSPETAFNIWLSPINIMLRHGEWIKPPLLKYLDSKVSFNFSEGNSELRTQLIDGIEYHQRDGIPVRDFDRSAHQATILTFEAPVTWEQLNGKTFDKPNVYGLVEAYYKGRRVRGHIMSVSLNNGIGNFKIKLYS